MNGLALCAGVGGLELGIGLATDDAARTVCFVEREAHAAATLVARMAEGALDPAPVWDDLATFDGRPWRGVVDCVSAGYPCQPFSLAGSRLGRTDPRHLWPHIARIISEVGADLVFVENVTGHLSLGFASVADDLERMGYCVACGVFSAREVGASHRRERLFALAYRQHPGRDGGGTSHHDDGGISSGDHDQRCGEGVADAVTGGRGERERFDHQPRRELVADGRGEGVVHPGRSERGAGAVSIEGDQGTGGVGEPDKSRVGHADDSGSQGRGGPECGGADQLPTWPPGPTDDWSGIPERFWPATSAQPGVRGVAHGMAARVDRLRAGGNGVVPLEGAYAFRTLSAELVRELTRGDG